MEKISYLTFIKRTTKGKHAKGLYRCICENEKEICIYHVNKLHTISCGCKSSRSTLGERNKTHGLAGKHPLYGVWNTIKSRCYNQSNKKYKNWGGSGITMCEDWKNNFVAFFDWCIGNGWRLGLQVDKDTKGGKIYSPENCIITTSKENNNKRRNNFIIEYDGRKQTLSEWSSETGICGTTIRNRIEKHKWSIKDALYKTPDYATNTQKHKAFKISNNYL